MIRRLATTRFNAPMLKERIESSRWMIGEIADAVGLSRAAVSSYVNGHRVPGCEVLAALAMCVCNDNTQQAHRLVGDVLGLRSPTR